MVGISGQAKSGEHTGRRQGEYGWKNIRIYLEADGT